MDNRDARRLIGLTNAFYRAHAASFSATRSRPWPGWERVAEMLEPDRGLRVFDLACGNLRFERFLAERFPQAPLNIEAWDSCPDLAAADGLAGRVSFRDIDVLDALLAGREPAVPSGRDLVACFGFFHHIPSAALRERVLDLLVRSAAPRGLIAISCWQFMDDVRLAAKVGTADAAARERGIDLGALDEGDHFLGWQGDLTRLRYCHHFDEAEIDRLVAAFGNRVEEVARFSSDGKSGNLNRYLIMKKIA